MALDTPDYGKYAAGDPIAYKHLLSQGLDEKKVKLISELKEEPEWMTDIRLKAFKVFKAKKMPPWGPKLDLDLGSISYYASPVDGKYDAWEDVPGEIKKTFDRIGIPEAERKFLAGSTAQYDSEAVYHKLKKEWEDLGVIFTDMDTALKEHPDIIRKHFGSVVPMNDNKFAALNTAVWSGGSFVLIPKGVKVKIPLQAYFRINTKSAGQFERTMIIADDGASVHYVEGCSAPIYSASSLHAAVVEVIARKRSYIRYTTIQNWSNNVYNLVTKRAVAHEDSVVEWLDGNIGCLTKDTMIFTNSDVKTIEHVGMGDYVYSLNQDFEIVRSIVRAKKENPPTPVFEIKTMNHRSVKATANHPFLVLRKEGRLSKIKWMRLDDIKTGDLIAVTGELPDGGHPRKLDFKQERGLRRIRIPSESSDELMWLLGFYTGDGYKERTRVCFAVPKSDKSRGRVISSVEKLFGVACQAHGEVVLRINSAALVDFFSHLGFTGTAKKKRIPQWVFSLPKTQKVAFIQGYMDADGYVKKGHRNMCISSANRHLLEDTKSLAIACGLQPLKISRWTRRDRLPLGKEVKGYTNYFLYFSQERIDAQVAFVPVTSIEYVGKEKTYDIEVDETHNFIANGIITHNSKLTMKYPCITLSGPRARGEVLSIAFAGAGQVQDAGAKMIHLAPETKSRIISKSISQGGGRSSYRGLVNIAKGSKGCKSFVQCDAYLLDAQSRSDTYPSIKIDEEDAAVGHEAKVGRISDSKLFYLMSRGIPEKEALAMIVLGFIESFTKELPMEYAVELNRLVELQLEGAVG